MTLALEGGRLGRGGSNCRIMRGFGLCGREQRGLLAEHLLDRGLGRGEMRERALLGGNRLIRTCLECRQNPVRVDDVGETGRLIVADLLENLALPHEGRRVTREQDRQRR